VFSEVFMAEEDDGVADRGLGDAMTVAVQTLLETLLEDFSTSELCSSTTEIS